MNPNKALWEKGDFTRIAETMRESGTAFVSSIGITKDQTILDLGCGDGNTAIPAARLQAKVLGVDIADNLVAAGRQRSEKEGLSNCAFQVGDASNLNELKDRHFDLTVSMFGAMFAPKPLDVAKEMVRVTRKGGKIVMANWIPGDPTLVAQILKISAAYTPAPPEGFVSPMLWGVEEEVTNRFVQSGIPKNNISFSRESFVFQADYSPAEFLSHFRHYYGPTMNAFEAAEKNGKSDALQSELESLFNSQNKSGNQNSTYIPATFLKVTVTC